MGDQEHTNVSLENETKVTDAELLTDGWGIYIIDQMEQIDETGLLKSTLQERQYTQGLEHLERLFNTQGHLWGHKEELIYMNCKGVLLTIDGSYKEAEIILSHLMQRTEEYNPTDEMRSYIYNNYGTAFGVMGYLDVFKEYLTKAEEITNIDNLYKVVSGTNLVFAKLLIDSRDNIGKKHDMENAKVHLGKMKNHYNQLEILVEQEKELNLNVILYRNKGNICMNLLRKSEAISCFREALEVNKYELGDDLLEGGINIYFGQVLGVFELYDDARDAFVSAENAYKRYRSNYLRIGGGKCIKGTVSNDGE